MSQEEDTLSRKVPREDVAGQKIFQATRTGAARINARTVDNNFPPRTQRFEDSQGNEHRRQLKGYEPLASGIQQSNVTSAIRSQLVSSNARVPGHRAGISKDMHSLKRKVLDKASGNIGSMI